MAKLIDGKQISAQIKDELKEEVAQMKERGTQVCPRRNLSGTGSGFLRVCAQ